jgi:hypothetical protein
MESNYYFTKVGSYDITCTIQYVVTVNIFRQWPFPRLALTFIFFDVKYFSTFIHSTFSHSMFSHYMSSHYMFSHSTFSVSTFSTGIRFVAGGGGGGRPASVNICPHKVQQYKCESVDVQSRLLKGTVSRDFSPPFLFIEQLYLGS